MRMSELKYSYVIAHCTARRLHKLQLYTHTMDEAQKHNVGQKEYLLHDSIYIKFENKVKIVIALGARD